MGRPDAVALIVIPTREEAGSLPDVLARIRAAAPTCDVLVVDGESRDGTGRIAREIGAQDAAVDVIDRPADAGLTDAYAAGFAWALARHYPAIVQMDADGSHDPGVVPRLLAALATVDLAIGSRRVHGGQEPGLSRFRRGLSRAYAGWARLALGLAVRDPTSGFMAWRRDALAQVISRPLASRGFALLVELKHRAARAGLSLGEVPIRFEPRSAGQSKLTARIALEAAWRTWALRRAP